MTNEFSPQDNKTYDALSEHEKQHVDSIDEGRAYVLKTVEKNVEVANTLAMIEESAINMLRQEIDASTISIAELVSQYATAKEEYNYDLQRDIDERLKQISDYDTLRGKDSSQELKDAIKICNVYNVYSNKTQKKLIDGLEPSDIPSAARLLQDIKFNHRKDLFEKVGSDDAALKQMYELIRGNRALEQSFFYCLKNPDLAIFIYKDICSRIDSEKSKNRYGGTFLSEMLVQHKKYDELLQLVDMDYLDDYDVGPFLHLIDSDKVLYDLAIRGKKLDHVSKSLVCITNKDLLSQFIENSQELCAKLSETERELAVTTAKKVLDSLSKKADVRQVGELKDANKFVMGIREDGTLCVAWSNTKKHNYHKDIFRDISQDDRRAFSNALRSGGWITVNRETIGKIVVTFCRSSGDFGNYSHRVLELIKEDILHILREKLQNKDVELDIQVSS